MRIWKKPETLYEWIERFLTVWGFASAVIVLLSFFGWIPWYELQIVRKAEVIPQMSIFPGQKLQLGADFAHAVRSPDIVDVAWTLRESGGSKYQELPRARNVPLLLKPDYSGIINVEVEVRVKGESDLRRGSSSINVVQIEPIPVKEIQTAWITTPDDWNSGYATTLEFYVGDGKWAPAKIDPPVEGDVGLIAAYDVPAWGGEVYARYKANIGNYGEEFHSEVLKFVDRPPGR